MSLWPYVPLSGATEVLEWKTDVLRARAGEQRQRLRERPRRQWHFSHRADADMQSSMRALVRSASAFEVPDWTLALYGGAIAAGSSVAVNFTTTGLGLAAGQRVVLWAGILANEVCTIESVSPTGIVLEYVATARSATIYRVDGAHAAVELTFDRPAGWLQTASITFEAAAVEQHAATTYSQYRGHDVLPLPAVVGAGSLAESLAWPADIFDNQTGLPAVSRQRDVADEQFTMRWHPLTPADIAAVRAWIASRYGRWLAFWLPSWQRDFTAAAAVGASDTTLRVFAPAGATSLGRTTLDLEIQAPGAVYYRRITTVSAGPSVDGRPTIDLTMDSALGSAIAAAAFGRISTLRCVRFAADRIEYQHFPRSGLAVAVPCIEVPVP